jgi:hypothetical protein
VEINKLLGYVINLTSNDLDKMELKKKKTEGPSNAFQNLASLKYLSFGDL